MALAEPVGGLVSTAPAGPEPATHAATHAAMPEASAEPAAPRPPQRADMRAESEPAPPRLAADPASPRLAADPASPRMAAEPASSRLAAEPVSPPAAAPPPSADDYSNAYSSFSHEPPFRPRRNPAKLWTMAAIAFAVLSLAVLGAVARYGLPQWLSLGPATVQTQPDLALSFPPNRQDRRTLPNGAEFFGVSGSIANVGKQRRAVPALLIVLRDAQNRVVYSWEVTSPKPVLAPGEVVPIVEAVTDIPKSAKVAEIGWKPN